MITPALALLSACHGPAPAPAPAEPAAARDPAEDAAALAQVQQWVRPKVPSMSPLPGVPGFSARDCGTCHAEIATEWAATTHAHAWTDRQYQAELAKDPSVAWLCNNCHIPLADQQPERVVQDGVLHSPSTEPNPTYDAALREEGVTCLVCHWRPEGIAAVHEGTHAPHQVVVDPRLSESGFCMYCHQAVARLESALVCTFDTGAEWKEAGQDQTCQECHMPRVTRPVVPGAPPRDGGRHLWPGALIPKESQTPEEAALFEAWLPGVQAQLDLPETATTGASVEAVVTLTNARAAHMLPTGDPERFLEAHLRALAPDGSELGAADARIGQVWEWWPEARKLDDTRLAPGQVLQLRVAFPMPPGGATVDLVVDHVRLSEQNAAFHELGDYPTRRRVLSEQRTVVEVND